MITQITTPVLCCRIPPGQNSTPRKCHPRVGFPPGGIYTKGPGFPLFMSQSKIYPRNSLTSAGFHPANLTPGRISTQKSHPRVGFNPIKKWCIHLSRRLYLNFNYLVSVTAGGPVSPRGHL